ncbi:hypothetical protein M8994_23075, partial [Brucella sp. 21LCYQ03]|nr:hypothetical protein [Brucella sp. 21LCYQ03]
LNGDDGLIPSLSMQLHDGRNFKPQLVGDSTALIINETLARMIKRDGLVAGQTLHWNNEARMIVGVVKDFVYNDVFSSSPEPLIISPTDYAYGQLYMKTKAGIDLPEMLVRMEKIIKANNPAYPVEYKFLDETFDRQFSSVMMIQHLATVFAVLSIIISCLGLFGLASFSA